MTKTFLATLLALSATAALAEPPVIATSLVSTADLDLSTAYGRKLLDQRLSRAVKDVCGGASEVDLAGQNEVRRCRTVTLAGVLAERDQRIAAASAKSIRVAAR